VPRSLLDARKSEVLDIQLLIGAVELASDKNRLGNCIDAQRQPTWAMSRTLLNAAVMAAPQSGCYATLR
jgi:hypothetical protein